MMIYEQRSVWLGVNKPQCQRKVANREYHARGACFKPYRLVQPADHIRTTRVHKPCCLAAVDSLGQSAMKKCILDIELVHGPRPRESQRENCTHCSRLHHWTGRRGRPAGHGCCWRRLELEERGEDGNPSWYHVWEIIRVSSSNPWEGGYIELVIRGLYGLYKAIWVTHIHIH
jgi:hypothetical protein